MNRGPKGKPIRTGDRRGKTTSGKNPRSPTDIDRIVGVNVRNARLSRDLTLAELGEEIGISHQQLQKYETGTNRMSAGILALICSTLRIPIESLFRPPRKRAEKKDAITDLRNEANYWLERITTEKTLRLTIRVLKALSS